MPKQTILAALMLALAAMCTPALAYSNVSPKPGIPIPAVHKVTSIQGSMHSLPLWVTAPRRHHASIRNGL
jgi:hypothetical protein